VLALAACLADAGRVALDDEQLALSRVGRRAIRSLPGKFSRCEMAVLRDTACEAAREASRAFAAKLMRSTMAVPAVRFWCRKVSSAGRMALSTKAAPRDARRSLV